MDQDVANVLEQFAANAKLSKNDLLDTSRVLQRYMAVHVTIAPADIAYGLVADDYKMVELQARNPPISVYRKGTRPVHVGTFITACKNMESSSHSFDQFREAVRPIAADEEKWMYLTSKERQWKDKAYFMALNFTESSAFKPLIEAIYAYPEKKANYLDPEPGRIYDQMVKYVPKQNPVQLAHDIGRMIASIHVDNDKLSVVTNKQEPDMQFKLEADQPIQRKKSAITISSDISPITQSFASLRPQMESYRKRAGLPATVDVHRLAKQMIYAASGMNHDEVPDNLLSRYQKKLTPVISDEERSVALMCVDAFISVPKSFEPNQSARAKAVSTLAKKKHWDAKTLLKAALVPQAFLEKHLYEKFEKQVVTSEVDKELCNVILELE